MHDLNYIKRLNTQNREDYTRYKRPYQEPPTQEPPHQDTSIQQPFFLFSNEGENKTPEEDEKDEAEFYF